MPAPPRVLVVLFLACAAITAAFVVTGPWTFGSSTVKNLQVVLLVWVPAVLVALAGRGSRRYLRELLQQDVTFSRRALWIGFAMVCLFLLRMTTAKFFALEVNAWDFSLSFDRPLERTVHGELLWSEDLRHSMLAVHCNWLLFAFVPLYMLVASPMWLVVAQASAIAAAVAALFWFVRTAARDDVVAAAIALAFLLHRSTARATQFVFIIDVFYPVALLLLFHAFLQRRPRLFALALLLTVSIKEDAIVPLAGFALVAALGYRRWRWAGATLLVAGAVYCVDSFVVLPAFSPWDGPTYVNHWATFGPTPLRALGGMLAAPWIVIARAVTGSFDLLATLAFTPFFGWPWLLASLPPLLIYGSSDAANVHSFTLHYSMPVLPALFAAIPFGIERMTRRFADRRLAGRILALTILMASALTGTTYKLDPPRPERSAIRSLVAAAGEREVYVQGALLPHAGYGTNVHALHHESVPPPASAFLLCAPCESYPFDEATLAARIETLQRDSRYEQQREGVVVLFRPR